MCDRESYSDSIQFGSATIHFEVEFRARRHIGITVKPDQRVVVAAPVEIGADLIRERVQRRAFWILRQLDHFERFRPRPTPRQYINGETFRYLGRQYRLKIVKGENPSVKLKGRYLIATTTDTKDRLVVQCLVEAWYSDHARALLHKRLDHCVANIVRFELSRPPLTVRRMSTRWGSCSKAGRILLNPELVKSPIECIDYVIVHELCHLKVMNHSAKYYRLLGSCMPDWRRRKERLETYGF